MEKSIFYENDCWNFTSKEVDLNTYQINYVTHTGYKSATEAAIAFEKANQSYEKSMKLFKKSSGSYSFTGFLDYWYNNILKDYAFVNYQIGCHWVLYNLIIPSVKSDIPLNMVTTSYINSLLKDIAPLCKSAGHQSKKLLNVVMKDALNDGYIAKNPMLGVDEYKEQIPPIVVYTKPQIKTLLTITNQSHANYLEVLLGLFCGLRPGEVAGLQYDDIDFNNKTLEVKRQLTRNYNISDREKDNRLIKPPKSYSSYRKIRVPDLVLNEIKARQIYNQTIFKRHPSPYWENFICIGPFGTPKSDGTVLSWLQRLCLQNGLPKITCHDLRHLYATILIEEGVPLEKISKLLGHKNPNTTFNVYCGIINGYDQIRNYVDSLEPGGALCKK